MYIFLMDYFALTGNIVKFNFKETMPTPRFEYIFGVYIYIYIYFIINHFISSPTCLAFFILFPPLLWRIFTCLISFSECS